jgi:hypothetical protein
MKIILDIVLEENVDKQEFIDSFDSDTQVSLLNIFQNIPKVIAVKVEESFLEEFKQDSRVLDVSERLPSFPASLPAVETMSNKTIISTTFPSVSSNGSDYAPLNFYLGTDQILNFSQVTNPQKIGRSSLYDDSNSLSNASYSSRWTGKNVDIVTLEVGPVSSGLSSIHDTHPDFDDLDNTGTSRIIPMDWSGLESSDNNQVSSNSCLSEHGMGVVSAAAGTICGFAKKSSIRLVYLNSDGEETVPGSTTDGPIEIANAVIDWHNNKSNNPQTGVKNPTILIGEWQYLLDRYYAYTIDTITNISESGTVVATRPGSSWGTDFTPFTSRNIIPFQVDTPDIGLQWCIVVPIQSINLALKTALNSVWDAGITFINAAGNNAGVFEKDNDSTNTIVGLTTGSNSYNIRATVPTGIVSFTNFSTGAYPFLAYGPHGNEKAIDVGAAYNSEGLPVVDGYTNRGPGIDIFGYGSQTWTAYPTSDYADGKWGYFSGTSCATPTIVGMAACMMERYFYYNGTWPTPDEVKQMVISNGKNVLKSSDTTNWGSVNSASTNIFTRQGTVGLRINTATSPNGGFQFEDLAGSTQKRGFFDPDDVEGNVSKQIGKRKNGVTYPRKTIRFNEVLPEEY